MKFYLGAILFIARFNGILRRFRILRRDKLLSRRSFGAAAEVDKILTPREKLF